MFGDGEWELIANQIRYLSQYSFLYLNPKFIILKYGRKNFYLLLTIVKAFYIESEDNKKKVIYLPY